MLIFIVFEAFSDFMGGGTPHEMLSFVGKTVIFVCISVPPGDSEAWRPGEIHGVISGGVPPPMTSRPDILQNFDCTLWSGRVFG